MRWLVLQRGANPSTDYYIRPRAAAAGVEAVYRDVDLDPPTAADLREGTQVVIVRYLGARWADALQARAGALAGVVYFMDDDLLSPPAWRGLPADYRLRLLKHWNLAVPRIAALASSLWVSTPELAARHRALDPQVVSPLPLAAEATGGAGSRPLEGDADGVLQIVYHGSQSHAAEARWLHGVVAACLDSCPRAHFEIIGNHDINRLYRGLPRTRILHPLSWPNYLAHTRTLHAHVGLAPILDTAFGATRSHTKVFDIARSGAVGLYSRCPAYAQVVRDGVDGLLLDNDAGAWTAALLQLLHDAPRLERMRRGAQRLVSDEAGGDAGRRG